MGRGQWAGALGGGTGQEWHLEGGAVGEGVLGGGRGCWAGEGARLGGCACRGPLLGGGRGTGLGGGVLQSRVGCQGVSSPLLPDVGPDPRVTEQNSSWHPGKSCLRASLSRSPRSLLGPTPRPDGPSVGTAGRVEAPRVGGLFPRPLPSCSFSPPCSQGPGKAPRLRSWKPRLAEVPEPSSKLTGLGAPANPTLLGAP